MPYGKTTSYLPIIGLLRSYFRITESDTQREIRERATGKLLALDRTLAPCVDPCLALLDVPVDDPRWQRLDPVRRRERTLEAVRRVLLREANDRPLLVIVEDLHWIDSETQAVLDDLAGRVPAARVLLLVSFRPEYRHNWASREGYAELRVVSRGVLCQVAPGPQTPSTSPVRAGCRPTELPLPTLGERAG